tara:strand:- start:1223 stop:1687 length:465 start_codon:yes stop_codon:yes gene_type:complete
MKTLLKTTFFAILLSTGFTGFGQTIANESEETTIKKVRENNDSYTVKTVIKKEQPLKLDPKDRGKVNQGTIETPVMVQRTIFIDNDNDSRYDKKVTMSYRKDVEESLDYMIAKRGIIFLNDVGISYVITEGDYEVMTKEFGVIEISVEEVEIKD